MASTAVNQSLDQGDADRKEDDTSYGEYDQDNATEGDAAEEDAAEPPTPWVIFAGHGMEPYEIAQARFLLALENVDFEERIDEVGHKSYWISDFKGYGLPEAKMILQDVRKLVLAKEAAIAKAKEAEAAAKAEAEAEE